ncbi:MAG TPA: 4Fe-4S dicluster domain-containing protein [Candidatus Omnitrophota bacterium]|nr:4Fe-4S dicluster domain-containing protein [Candidatus Omnitrophota bacterium]
MGKRKIIEIDRNRCNGCGLCTTACAEGALVLDAEKKAVLVKEIFCDGMGACLNVCPVNALKIVERDSAAYDPKAAYDHVLKTQGTVAARKVHGAPGISTQDHTQGQHVVSHVGGCPGSMAREIQRSVSEQNVKAAGSVSSELSQWPIQLHLISPQAPYFQECDLLIAADCTAFALGSFHQDLLKGKKLVIACPKLDETESYVEKIAELLKKNTVYSLTVVIMEVPCCSGLFRIVQQAVELAKIGLPIKKITVGLDGTIRN